MRPYASDMYPAAARALAELPRVALAHLPTPLERLPQLGEAFGLANLWVKRDDCTGLATGGNKARKLEFLIAEARARGCDTVITTGGLQSNHARMTAAAANRYGLHAVLALSDPAPASLAEWQGNLLIDRILGAEVRFSDGLSYTETHDWLAAIATELREKGRNPYIIPVGGSTPLGCLGYATAMAELAAQARERDLTIHACVSAVGSTGTLAGMLLGQRLFLSQTRVIGISVASPVAFGARKGAGIASAAAERLGAGGAFSPDDIELYDDWLGDGYAVPTADGLEVIHQAALLEGLLIDPVYTGKALAGLRGLARRGEIYPEQNVVFWHTGGAAALFAFAELFTTEK